MAKEIKSYWVLVAGFVLLLIFVMIQRMPSGGRHRLGPGGTRHNLGPGGTRQGSIFNRLKEAFTGSQSEPTFTMIGASWCGHCKKAKPIFDNMGSKVTIGDHAVYLRYIDGDKDKEAAKGYAVEGYPTFYLDHGSNRVKYDGPRNADGFREFLHQQLS